jgi:hypothetical protein
MAEFNLERIRFRWKSDWTVSTDYVKDDVVRFEGKSYVCLIGHSSGSTSIYGDLNLPAPNTRWELMFDGNQWRSDWTPDTLYNLGDIIKYNGYLYQCTAGHQSTNIVSQGPIDDIEKWTIVATTYNWLNTWTPSVANIDPLLAVPQYYNLGDVVTYNGITYICTAKHLAASTYYLGLEFDQDKWKIVTRSDNWRTDWTVNTRYAVDDIVKYGAISYRCLTGHTSNTDLALGLEDDQAKWEIFLEGIDYKGVWSATTRYKRFDIVKSGGSLWRSLTGHTSTTTLREDLVNWSIWVPGLEFETVWDSGTEYNAGDIVVYGGYSYTALTNNTNSVPSVNGILQDTGDWEILVAGYRHLGDWSAVTAYKTGDVLRDQGYLYIAVGDSTNIKPDTDTTKWQILVDGRKWKNYWTDNIEYHLGDVVTYAGVAYICINRHLGTESENRPDLDLLNTENPSDIHYWTTLLQGTASNVMTTRGDLRTRDASNTLRFGIGLPGNIIKSIDGNIAWENFEEVANVFYVATSGNDIPGSGLTLNAPFRTVKYACQYVADNINNDTTNATIFIKTGIFEEELPITVPRNCALVGDELRSTVITPESGSISSNMFYVNNGSGIRNMTLQGLTGILGVPNQYLTRRPTAGAYVSLDPGTGPDDSSVWITNKSCYVQNVTTFGTGCIGMKIDGALHNGGNRSVVANDFTQVISDGIGYWALNGGRSELVSVFTYFCHIGYLSENGGILRATNGNNSYGTYGSVAEGYNANEVPITGKIDNRTLQAQVQVVHTNGTIPIGVAYSHAGQSYTNASGTISGPGINASIVFDEFRNNAISQVRLIDPADSSTPGGLNYQYLLNNAQSGTTTTLTLAASDDTGTAAKYVGMRIFIDSGAGVGQYGYISGYDDLTKIAIISKESNDTGGWDHIYPGWPIENVLDGTTRYKLEPAVNFPEPDFSTSSLNPGVIANAYKFIVSDKNQKILVVPAIINQSHAYSIDAGTTWANIATAIETSADTTTGVVYTGQEFIITSNSTFYYTSVSGALDNFTKSSAAANNYTGVSSDGAGNVVLVQSNGTVSYSSDHGSSYASATGIAGLPAYGNSKFIIVNDNGSVAYSADSGATWTTTSSALTASTWTSLVYGDGKFVAIGSANTVAYSFDGITWYENTIISEDTFYTVSYGAGVFIASGNTNKLAKSQDGKVWSTYNLDSTSYTLDTLAFASEIEYMPLTKNWIAVSAGSTWNTVEMGATAFARLNVSSSRIQDFIIYNPGSNYKTDPFVTITDTEATVPVEFDVRINDGVLSQPVFTNRGEGYVTATATVTGDGIADIFQTGKTISFKDISFIPGPGANIVINGIDDVTYRLTKIVSQTGAAPNHTMVANISPTIKNQSSPNHEETLIIREQYSQVRLTGHDFLDIGVGNVTSTRYPELYTEGEDPNTPRQPFNETVDNGGGRVFYTSTDQDGNFRVGELFQVEQASGTVTINADLFELDGLSELSLGGIQVGGSAVVIKEFSKDGTFVANSNNIVPTQAAIMSYLESRISSGGADALTNTLIAGQVKVSSTNFTTTSGLQINIPVSVHQIGGIGGDMLAHQLFGI